MKTSDILGLQRNASGGDSVVKGLRRSLRLGLVPVWSEGLGDVLGWRVFVGSGEDAPEDASSRWVRSLAAAPGGSLVG